MATTVKANLNSVNKILADRKLDGQAQLFFTSEVKRMSDPYTPMDNGILKSNVTINTNSIVYNSPYSRYQYYGVSKNGKPLNYQGAPMRGKMWVERCWADRGQEITESVAKFVGGVAK